MWGRRRTERDPVSGVRCLSVGQKCDQEQLFSVGTGWEARVQAEAG